MASPKRIGRWVLIGAGGVIAIFVLLWLGVGIYLRTSAGREIVATRLQSAIGLPVDVSAVSLGARNSSLSFRILDPKLDPASLEAPILSVESASADVSLGSILTGHTNPHEVHLKGLELYLRLDSKGNLLTTMPEEKDGRTSTEIPAIYLDSGRIRIAQQGRPEFLLSGVSLKAESNGDLLTLHGSIDDPAWGKWILSGELNKTSKSGWIELGSDDVHLTADHLDSIPYVPSTMWSNVRPEGHVKPFARIEIGSKKGIHYDAILEARGLSLGIPPAEITLAETTGMIHVHDGMIEIGGSNNTPSMTAKLAGGMMQANAKWEFDKDPSVGDPIHISVKNLAVNQLPEKWGLKSLGGQLPGKLSLEHGFLSGDANLRLVAYSNGRLETFGGGTGAIHVPAFEGGTLDIGVKLGGNGQKLEFHHSTAPPKPPEKKAALPPERTEISRATSAGACYQAQPDLRPIILALIALQQKTEPRKADTSQQTNLDATITLRDIDIAQFLEQMEIKIPYKVAGRVTVQAKFGVPLQESATRSSYRLSGSMISKELRFEGLTVRDLSTEVIYQNGKFTLTHLQGTIPQTAQADSQVGTFSGAASAVISPPGDITAKLTLDRIPVESITAAIPNSTLSATGLISGQAEFSAPYPSVSDPASWHATAAIKSETITIAGRTAKDFSIAVVVEKGVASLKDTKVTIESIPITASGQLTISGQYPFDAVIKTTGTSIADFRKLVPEAQLPLPVEGVFETTTKASGQLSPLKFTLNGEISATKVMLAKTSANHIDVKWDMTEERLRISDLHAAVFGGMITGNLYYPLSPEKKGDFALSFKDVDAAAASAFVPDIPVKITGDLSGKVTGVIPPGKDGGKRIGDLNVDITAPKLTVQNIPAERLTGKAAIKNGIIEYSLEGKTLGGSFDVKGRYPGTKQKDDKGKGRGALRVIDLDLARLAGALRMQSLKPLAGRVDVIFDYENDFSTGSGRIVIRGLRWGKEDASPEIVGVLLLEDGIFVIRDLSGTLAGGIVRGRARIPITKHGRNFFLIAVDRANAERLTAAIPGASGRVTGEVTATVHGSFGAELRGSGSISLVRGSVAGARVSNLLIPFDFATSSRGQGGQFSIRQATLQAGAGRATASLILYWAATMRVRGDVQFIDVPLRDLSPSLGNNSFLGGGRITGRADISGAEVRSIDDLTGTIVARLTGASAQEIPLIQDTLPYLNTLGLAKPFEKGDLRGTLSRGIFRVQRLALANPGAQLFADGTATLQNGRLDLNVVAHTGPVGPQAGLFRVLASRLPLFGPVPIGLIREVSDLVSNRTIRLAVTGTMANPSVRVNTGALLTEEAVRFLLSRYILPTDVSTALGYGTTGNLP